MQIKPNFKTDPESDKTDQIGVEFTFQQYNDSKYSSNFPFFFEQE